MKEICILFNYSETLWGRHDHEYKVRLLQSTGGITNIFIYVILSPVFTPKMIILCLTGVSVIFLLSMVICLILTKFKDLEDHIHSLCLMYGI